MLPKKIRQNHLYAYIFHNVHRECRNPGNRLYLLATPPPSPLVIAAVPQPPLHEATSCGLAHRKAARLPCHECPQTKNTRHGSRAKKHTGGTSASLKIKTSLVQHAAAARLKFKVGSINAHRQIYEY